MILNNEWKIEYDSNNVILIHTQEKEHDNGKKYQAVETYYYPNVKMALKNFLNKSLSGSEEIIEVIYRIEEIEKIIKNLK